MSFPEAAEAAGHPEKIKNSQSKHAKPKNKTNRNATVTDEYDYVDERGELKYQVCRTDPKGFFQRRPGKKEGSWVKDMKGVTLIPYRLPDIGSKKGIFFVEGEKDVNELWRVGLPATCNPGGAGKIPSQQEKFGILDHLAGKKVYIIPDNDEAGFKHAEQLAEMLYGIASHVSIINLPGIGKSGDVSDFILDNGDSKAKEWLINLAKSSVPWRPPSNFLDFNEYIMIQTENHIPVLQDGILPFGENLLIAGEGGVGKSLVRLELSIHLAVGWDYLNFKTAKPRKVAIFQWENSEFNEVKRARRMIEGLGINDIPNGQIKFMDRKVRPNISQKGGQEKLLELVKESEAEVIFYDCLTNMHSSKENDNVQMRSVLDFLSDINAKVGVTSVLIHHFGKPSDGEETGKNSKHRIRGASSIIDWGTTIFTFAHRPNKEHRPWFEIRVQKMREGPLYKWTTPILMERDGDYLTHKMISEESTCPPDKVREMLEQLGGEVSSRGPLIDKIIEETGAQKSSAYNYINKALEDNMISKKGKRGLTVGDFHK